MLTAFGLLALALGFAMIWSGFTNRSLVDELKGALGR